MVEATGSQGGGGGPQAIREARPGKKQRSRADVITELYCFVQTFVKSTPSQSAISQHSRNKTFFQKSTNCKTYRCQIVHIYTLSKIDLIQGLIFLTQLRFSVYTSTVEGALSLWWFISAAHSVIKKLS